MEFNLFSGRPRPKALIADSGVAKAILDSLAVRIAQTVPCSEIPAMPSTPLYTATLLLFSVPVAQRLTLIVRNGFIYYDTSKPCYRDPGSNLEKAAVAAAFQYEDLSAPGGPKPMDYLSCMVPDSLHAGSQPCVTGLQHSPRRGNLSGGQGHPASQAGSALTDVPGPRKAPCFSWSGRFRPIPSSAHKRLLKP